jgi:hypothetical protein
MLLLDSFLKVLGKVIFSEEILCSEKTSSHLQSHAFTILVLIGILFCLDV